MCTIAESAEIGAALRLRLAGRPHTPFRCCAYAMVTVKLADTLLQVDSFAGTCTGTWAGRSRSGPLPSEAPQPTDRSQPRRGRAWWLGSVARGQRVRRHGQLRDLDHHGGWVPGNVGGRGHRGDRAMVRHPEKHAGGQVGGGVVRGLRRDRWKSQGRRRRRYIVGLGDGETAERAGGVGGEPHVDALGVEAVAAAGQEPRLLAVLELGEAHGALHRVLLPLVRTVVHRDRQRAQQLRVDAPAGPHPTAATTGGRPRTTAPPPAPFVPVPAGVEAVLEGGEDQGEDDEEKEDARDGEDAAERHGGRRTRRGRHGSVGVAAARPRPRRVRSPGAFVGTLRHAVSGCNPVGKLAGVPCVCM